MELPMHKTLSSHFG